MSKTERITGTIIGVRHYGTIFIVFLGDEEGRVLPVIYDHRMFRNLLEGEGFRPDELMGRQVRFDSESLVFEE